ncbi:hypothetical protein H4582DRAFT_2061154 [Lactarius indigo]|nr:hypothetical protein H4582DRAFT_2061154 [Lactarius indigo]
MSSAPTSRDSLESMDNISNKSIDIDLANMKDNKTLLGPTDITEILDELTVEADDRIKQLEVLNMIIASNYEVDANSDNFNNKEVKRINLSELKKLYERKSMNAVKLLSRWNRIKIDKGFCIEASLGNVGIKMNKMMIDYHLTIGNRIGLSPMLPNIANLHQFSFELDLGKPYQDFKGKHTMVGLDMKGRFLFIGQAMNEDVFLAMAPNKFLQGKTALSAPGHSTGASLLSRQHYHQMVIMFAHFLKRIPDQAYMNVEDIYEQNLENEEGQQGVLFLKIYSTM